MRAVTVAPHVKEVCKLYATPTARGMALATADSGTTVSTGVGDGTTNVADEEGVVVIAGVDVGVDVLAEDPVRVQLPLAVLVRDGVQAAYPGLRFLPTTDGYGMLQYVGDSGTIPPTWGAASTETWVYGWSLEFNRACGRRLWGWCWWLCFIIIFFGAVLTW